MALQSHIKDVAMGTTRRPTLARLKTILKRQSNPSWDINYAPAIRAVRGEAPSISHAFTVRPEKLARRDVHLLSLSELSAALLGFYHPAVVGLQEQRILSPTETLHPLHNFPGVVSAGLPQLKGIIDVADRLDMLSLLPRVRDNNPDDTATRREIIFPFIGDLLWAIRDKNGNHYCINWSVKDSEDAFKRPLAHERFITRKNELLTEPLLRHEIERTYYADAGIRTILVAGDKINDQVHSNLRHLFLHHSRHINLTTNVQSELLERYKACLETGTPPSVLIARLTAAGKYSIEDCKNVFYQSIWFRKLRVDLQKPILIDRPLHPESQDILDIYADWFRGAPC